MSGERRGVDWSADTKARITDEHIERARSLVGYDEASSRRELVSVASADNIRAFALSYGSDNPLHCDPEYARNTRWGDVVAPAPMVMTMCAALRGDPRPEAIARAKKGLFKGVHQLHGGSEYEWYRPIRPGDTIYRFGGQESVEVKKSEFANTTVLRMSRDVQMNQHGQVVCVHRLLLIHSERSTATKRGKYKEIAPADYTENDLAEIDAIYAAETVRGPETRFWEDVEIGDSLGVMAKGPLTLSDIICLHTSGFASLPFGAVTSREAYKRRQKMPASFVKNKRGIPDTVMRMHWDDEWAQAVGSPMAYDYALQREFWGYHFLTDWCGDDGIVLRMRAEARKFNYIGDFQKITGEVVDKHLTDGSAAIDVKLHLVSQRKETTMEVLATVALPSRENGEARYLDPPREIAERAQAFLARHHELSPVHPAGRQVEGAKVG
jgi:acyl dehydratase